MRETEDKRLLENGEIDLLLAGWYELIVGRCWSCSPPETIHSPPIWRQRQPSEAG